MFFYYFGLIVFIIIVLILVGILCILCFPGHWVFYQFTKPELRAYDNKLQYYRLDGDNPKWVPLRCAVMRKSNSNTPKEFVRHWGEEIPIMIYSIDELNEYRKKLSNYNKLLKFIKVQESLKKDYNTFDEQQRIIQ